MLFVYSLYNQGKSIYNISPSAAVALRLHHRGSETTPSWFWDYPIVVLRLHHRGSETTPLWFWDYTFVVLRLHLRGSETTPSWFWDYTFVVLMLHTHEAEDYTVIVMRLNHSSTKDYTLRPSRLNFLVLKLWLSNHKSATTKIISLHRQNALQERYNDKGQQVPSDTSRTRCKSVTTIKGNKCPQILAEQAARALQQQWATSALRH